MINPASRFVELVHFSGDLDEAERALLRNAIAAYEARQEDPPPDVGARWVVVVEEVSRYGRFYFAHRLGHQQGLHTRSASELAAKIATLDDRP